MFEQTSMYNQNAYSMVDTHNICTSYAIHFAMISDILHKMWTSFLFCVIDLTNGIVTILYEGRRNTDNIGLAKFYSL